MNARIRDKQAAYLAAMGREAPDEPRERRGANVVDMVRPPGASDADEVTITYDTPRRTTWIRAKTTRAIVADLCRALEREPRQLVATPTKQGDFHSAWIKATDGTDVGKRLAFVTGLTPTVINIVLGRPIERLEQVKGRFYALGSSHAVEARAQEAGEATADADSPARADPVFEPELSGADE